MSQHDYSIANQTGLEFRADLNNVLAAIVTDNSGSTAPSATFPGMVWRDTSVSPSVLKKRNDANDAWVTTLTAAGEAVSGASTAAAQRTALELGNAATLTAGTSANNLVQLNGSAKLPALDASLLINLPGNGNFAGVNAYNASATLLATDIGKLVAFYGSTASQTLTLPKADTVLSGKNINLVNQGTVSVTIASNAANTFSINTQSGASSVTSIILSPGESLVFSSNAVTVWNCFGDVVSTGSFTITGTGFSTTVTATATYKVIKGVVHLYIPISITGTSNATSFTLTGLPAAITPSVTKGLPIVLSVDSGNPTWASVSISNTGVVTLNKTGLSSAWTASGTKTLNVSEFVYRL